MTAPIEQLSLCPGLGEKRVRRLYDAFHKPFVGSNSPIKKKRPSLDEFVFKANKKQNINNSAATNKNNNNNESDEKNDVVVMEDDEKEVKNNGDVINNDDSDIKNEVVDDTKDILVIDDE
jgi:hypothetical protein